MSPSIRFDEHDGQIKIISAPCPICASACISQIKQEHLSIVGMEPITIGYGVCTNCGHLFQSVPAFPRYLESYYIKFSNYVQQQIAHEPSAMSKRLLSIVQDFTTEPGIMLEVGCGIGHHLHWFEQAKWEVYGCEPSLSACEKAKELYGLDIDNFTEDKVLPGHTNLDLVLYSGVLEHLADPITTLQRAHAALRIHGLVVFEVPLAIFPQLLPPGWLCFEHLQYFSLTALNNLMNHAGFELLEARVSLKGFIYPCVTGVARKTFKPDSLTTRDTGFNLNHYLIRDDAIWEHSEGLIAKVKKPFYLWGAGIHTSILLSRFPELKPDILAIIDSDPQKQGQFLAGLDVISPADLRENIHVVISSFAQEQEIYDAWIDAGKSRFHIQRLYNI